MHTHFGPPGFMPGYAKRISTFTSPKEALRHCYTGIRLAKAIEDTQGATSLEELQHKRWEC